MPLTRSQRKSALRHDDDGDDDDNDDNVSLATNVTTTTTAVAARRTRATLMESEPIVATTTTAATATTTTSSTTSSFQPPAKRTRSQTTLHPQLLENTNESSTVGRITQAVSTTTTSAARGKKARLSFSSSTTTTQSPEDAAAAPAVTPGTGTRPMLRLATTTSTQPTSTRTGTALPHPTSHRRPTVPLPPNVVDIFAARRPRDEDCDEDTTKDESCVVAVAPLILLARQHVIDYGRDYHRNLLRQQTRDQRWLVPPPAPQRSSRSGGGGVERGTLRQPPPQHQPRLGAWAEEEEKENTKEDHLDDDDGATAASHSSTPTRSWSELSHDSNDRSCRHHHDSVSNNNISNNNTASHNNDHSTLPNQPLLTIKMRRILVQWMTEVCIEYKLSEATYHLAVTLLDMVLTLGPTVAEWQHEHQNDTSDNANAMVENYNLVVDTAEEDEEQPQGEQRVVPFKNKFLIRRNDFQALGCACMWIASKMEDMTPPRTEDLVYISDYSFSSEKLRSLETRICQELQFRLHRVTPFHFVSVYLRASQAACADVAAHHTDLVLHLTLYLLELSRSCYALSLRKPNLLAAACVYLARATLGLREKPLWQSRPVLFNITPTAGDADAGKRTNLNQNNRSAFWTETLEYYTGYSVEHLTDTILQIHRLHTAAELSSTGVTPAFTKYKTDAHHRVSLKTVVRVEDLGFVTAISHEDLTVNTEHAVLL